MDLRPVDCGVALSDFTGRILRSVDVPPTGDPREAAAAIARVVRRVLKYSGDEKVEGTGVGLIGLIEPTEGRMLAAEGLGWGDDVPFGAYLWQALNLELPLKDDWFSYREHALEEIAREWLEAEGFECE